MTKSITDQLAEQKKTIDRLWSITRGLDQVVIELRRVNRELVQRLAVVEADTNAARQRALSAIARAEVEAVEVNNGVDRHLVNLSLRAKDQADQIETLRREAKCARHSQDWDGAVIRTRLDALDLRAGHTWGTPKDGDEGDAKGGRTLAASVIDDIIALGNGKNGDGA